MAAAANVVGDMVLYVHKAQHLRDTEVFGKQDPYVKLSLGPANMQAKRTAVKDDAGTSAVWEEKFNFHLVGVESTLDLHVLNKEVVTDETIGRCSIPLEKLLESDKPMWYTLDKNYGYILMTCKFKGTLKGNPVNTLEHIDAKQEQPAPPAKPAEVAAPNPFHVVPTAEAKTSVVAELKLAEVCNPKQAVANAYMAIIGRKAPDNFVNVYSDRLSSGKAALPGLVVSLLESDEFAARGLGTLHSLPVRSLIGFTFEALTGNSPTRSAYEECTAKLAQMPREEFVFWVASRQEAKDRLSNPKLAAVPFHRRRTPIIARFYSTVLGRDIDNWGVSTYVTGVNNYKYSVSDVFQLLLDSEEFGTKGKGNFNTIANDEFVRVMVRAFFERDDEAGTAFHAARLNNNSISKSQLLDEFASCPEFLEKVAADYVEPVSHDFKSPEPTHPENSVASAYIAVRRTEPNLEFVQFHAHRLKTKQCQFADVVIALLNEERKGGLSEYEPLDFVGRVFEAVTGTMLTHAGKSNWTLLELEKHETREDFVRYAASTPLSHLRHTTFGHMMYYNFGDMLVKQFFRAYLGRDVNGEAVSHHTAFLNRYEWTPADMVVHFMNCPEFATKGKGDFNSCNSHEFVSMLVHAFFSRNPSEGDIKYHADRLDAGQVTRLQLADEFTTSEEMFIHRHKVLTGLVTPMVERFYRVFMGREPDAGGLEHYVERICLRKLTITTVIELMLDSPEFQAKGKGHFLTVDSRELVKMLTASLFNHEADDAGIQYHSKRVDSHAISRHDLVLEFCHCPEFRDHYPGL